MKKYASLLLFLFSPVILFGQEDEKEAIQHVIQSAYIDGIHNLGNIEDIEKGFHPGFVLLGMRDNLLTQLPIYTWIEYVKEGKKENPEGPAEKTTCKYLMIDITGNSAVAKIELSRSEKLIFTDYLFLYKFDEGWRIVSKVYYRHPEEK